MPLSPGLSELASQFSAAQRDAIRSQLARNSVRQDMREIMAHGATRKVAAAVVLATAEPATLAGAQKSGSGHSRKRDVDMLASAALASRAVAGSEGTLFWSSEASEWSRKQRSRAARKGRRTESRRAAATMHSRNPAYVGRPFDGTNARVRDGGTSATYRPGISGAYGMRITEAPRASTFPRPATGLQAIAAQFTQAQRDAIRAQLGMEAGKRVPKSGTGHSGRKAEAPGRVTPDPYSGTWEEFRAALLVELRCAGRHMGKFAVRGLWDFRKWAVRMAISGAGDGRWAVAVRLVTDVCSAIREGAEAGAVAEVLCSADMAWALPE